MCPNGTETVTPTPGDFAESVKRRAEDLVKVGMPAKVAELNAFLKSEFDSMPEIPESELSKVDNFEPTACNQNLLRLHRLMKPLYRALMEDVKLLLSWLSFLTPRIEDGNNFGVTVQEEALRELRTIESLAMGHYTQISTYYDYRGYRNKTLAKCPKLDDIRQLLHEYDESQWLNLRLNLIATRDAYALMHDRLIKNWDKILQPRTTNSENLY
jgi:hypothetical protein